MAELETLLDDAIGVLDGAGVTWAVIGGCARNAYAEPRATRDVDFVVEVDPVRFGEMEGALARAGFKRASAVTEPGETVPDLALYRDPAGRRIDVLFAHTAFERSALGRRKALASFGRVEAYVVSVEDLIVYKIIADRSQDRADIDAVIAAQRTRGIALDWQYIEHWCEVWDALDRARTLRATLGG